MTSDIREPDLALRQKILAHLTHHPRASAADIAKAIGMWSTPSEVVNELNALRTDGLVDANKAKGEGSLRYWLVGAEAMEEEAA